ncbi:MAG: hypothetical protein V4724_04090 [Pseudomonadota bacterium]
MRQITVEVPSGELANLERITLVEADSMPKNKPLKRTYKILKSHKSRLQKHIKTLKLENRVLHATEAAAVSTAETIAPEVSKARSNTAQPLVAHPTMQSVAESPRERRSAALSKVFGILKGRNDAPQDGLIFQLEMRDE